MKRESEREREKERERKVDKSQAAKKQSVFHCKDEKNQISTARDARDEQVAAPLLSLRTLLHE